MAWSVALLLYALPVLVGIRHFEEEVEDCRAWMRSEGEWYPMLAPIMAALGLAAWPLLMAYEAVAPAERP